MINKLFIWVLWPSFLVAAGAEALFFTVFDPSELSFFGVAVADNRVAAYSIGFFLFWTFAAASSALTCFLQRTSEQINRCPLPANARPLGCPKRADEGGTCC